MRCGGGTQCVLVVSSYDETVATFRHGDGSLCVSAIDAGNFIGLLCRGADRVDRLLNLRSMHILRRAAAKCGREVIWSHEEPINAGRGRDCVDAPEGGGRLNYGEGKGGVIGLPHVVNGCCVRALQRHRAQWPPAALPKRWVFRSACKTKGVGGAVDHWRDDRFRPEVERARDKCQIIE